MAAPEGNFCRDFDNVWHRVGGFRERIASYAGVIIPPAVFLLS